MRQCEGGEDEVRVRHNSALLTLTLALSLKGEGIRKDEHLSL